MPHSRDSASPPLNWPIAADLSNWLRHGARLLASSYEWHEEHGPFGDLRPVDWRLIFAAAAALTAMYVAALLLIDPDFFLSLLHNDQLKYFLKAARFAETAHTDARLAVNLPPFHYVSLPGVLLAPALWASSDFSVQLRLMQLTNAVGLAACFVLGAGVVAARVAPSRRVLVVAVLACCTLVNRLWFKEVSLPNATIPFMFGSFGATLAAWAAVRGRGRRERAAWWGLFAVGAVMSFSIKFTAVSLLGYAAVLLAGQALTARRLDRLGVVMILALAMAMGVVSWASWDTIQHYVSAGQGRLAATSPKDWLLYLVAVALPNTLLPGFLGLYAVDPLPEATRFVWMTNPRDGGLVATGLFISAAVLVGAWRLRKTMLPEALLVASILPVIAGIASSAPRYLLPYAPWIWILAITAAKPVAGLSERSLGWWVQRTLLAAFATLLLAAGWFALSHEKSVRSTTAGTLTGLRSHVEDVTDTYRALRVSLSLLPRDSTELLLFGGNLGVWGPVLGLSSYAPDERLRLRVQQKQMYLIAVCELRVGCRSLDLAVGRLREGLDKYGPFVYTPFAVLARPPLAIGVYRVLPVEGVERVASPEFPQARRPPEFHQ